MKLTDALLGEHGVFYALFEDLERSLSAAETADDVHRAAAPMAAALTSHAELENEVLFPALEARIGPAGPLAVMRAEHEEIEALLEDLPGIGDPAQAAAALRDIIDTARNHFAKEENVLFRLAAAEVPEAELCELARRWATARGVALG